MKTVIILSHPELEESSSQQFLLHSLPESSTITIRHLESIYPDGTIDVEAEQKILRTHDRILFQFPFYWYSSPPLLKKWQDEVLTEHFAYGYLGNQLNGKEFGLILVIGVSEKEYQAGGEEGFSISELTAPYRALAKKTRMHYLKPLSIFQFPYMQEAERMKLLITYQQWLTLKNSDSLKEREEWMIQQLKETDLEKFPENSAFILEQVMELIEDNRLELDELRMHVDNYEE